MKEVIKKIEQAIKDNEIEAIAAKDGRIVVRLVNRNIGLAKAIEIIKNNK